MNWNRIDQNWNEFDQATEFIQNIRNSRPQQQ